MITISVTTLNAKPVAPPLAARFGKAGGTIGRSPDNTLALPDPDRKISRTHATIVFRDGGFALRDQGSVTPVVLNGEAIGNGRERPIAAGDEIRIGPYVLAVGAAAAADGESTLITTAPAAVAPGASITAPSGAAAAAEPAPLAEPVVSWQSEAPAAAPGEGITTVILHGEGEHATAAEGEHAAASGDGAEAAPTQPAAPVASPPAPTAQVAAASAAAAPAVTPVSTDELLRALLKGAGVRDVDIPGGLTPELMRKLGELLREATRGLLDMLEARASTKRDVRADMTVIVASDNNPLKFSPDLEAALTHLLVPKGRGFMPPLRALSDAYEDLRTHQVGFMAGMRSALAVVLARFDPNALEQRSGERSFADSFLPGNRKAKLWDQFTQLYGQVSNEAESDFHALFGAEFLKTYRAHAVKAPAAADSPARH